MAGKIEVSKEELKKFLERLTSYHNIRIDDAGEGIFILFYNDPSWDEKEIVKLAKEIFSDVQWCPEPWTHASENEKEPEAVLNCFF
jgi:hypothetical protein